jgi:ferredoxin-NADP reductase
MNRRASGKKTDITIVETLGKSSDILMTNVPRHFPPNTGWQGAKVKSISVQTDRIKSFFLSVKTPFEFIGGQHVDVRLTAPDGYQAMRSYSIASSPLTPEIVEISVERLLNGEVSPFFHDEISVGDEIEIRGPLGGHFVWEPKDGGPLLLIGGGSGVAPLMSMIRRQKIVSDQVATTLLLSSRTWNEMLFREELLEIESLRQNFKLVVALTREPPRRPGDYPRRIDNAMMSEIFKSRFLSHPKQIFICGANSFVNTAAESLLFLGVNAKDIRTERYGV